MAKLTVTVNSAGAPIKANIGWRRLWRGTGRKRIKKLLNECKNVLAMDTRAREKAALSLYEPLMFTRHENSVVAEALNTLIDRCNNALEEKV